MKKINISWMLLVLGVLLIANSGWADEVSTSGNFKAVVDPGSLIRATCLQKCTDEAKGCMASMDVCLDAIICALNRKKCVDECYGGAAPDDKLEAAFDQTFGLPTPFSKTGELYQVNYVEKYCNPNSEFNQALQLFGKKEEEDLEQFSKKIIEKMNKDKTGERDSQSYYRERK